MNSTSPPTQKNLWLSPFSPTKHSTNALQTFPPPPERVAPPSSVKSLMPLCANFSARPGCLRIFLFFETLFAQWRQLRTLPLRANGHTHGSTSHGNESGKTEGTLLRSPETLCRRSPQHPVLVHRRRRRPLRFLALSSVFPQRSQWTRCKSLPRQRPFPAQRIVNLRLGNRPFSPNLPFPPM